MLSEPANGAQPVAVLFSGGLDSAVLLAMAAAEGPAVPVYVSVGLAWEPAEVRAAERLLEEAPFAGRVRPLVRLNVDMRDVYPESHWAIRGDAPGFDTPDSDVYLEGRNVILLSKAAVYMARAGMERVLIGPLAGNPFPDATPQFFAAMSTALSLGLATSIHIEAPLAHLHKEDVVRLGRKLGVPLELTLSCMQPEGDGGCGRCSKCREREEGFRPGSG